MVGVVVYTIAFIPAVIISIRRRAHIPLTVGLFVAIAQAALWASDAPRRVQLAAIVALSAASAFVYLDQWVKPVRWYSLTMLVWVLAPDDAWSAAVWLPNALAASVGLMALWNGKRAPVTITGLVAMTLIANDVVGLAVATWDHGLAWPGRVGAVVAALIQVGWLRRQRVIASENRLQASAT